MAVAGIGLLAGALMLAGLSGAWLLGRRSQPQGLTSGEPTSSPPATQLPASSPAATRLPAPSPTPAQQPETPTIAPAPAAEGMTELFSCYPYDLNCGWDTYSYTSSEVYAIGPQLFLVAKGPYGLAETDIPGVSVQDFYLYFVAKLNSESGAGSYGVAFRCDPADTATFAYELELLASGEYRVWQWVDFELTRLASGTADLDPTGENLIAVLAQGPSLHFYVNGDALTEITDAELREGPIRLRASVIEEADIEVAISQVVVEAQ